MATIVYIEDEPMTRKATSNFLSKIGHIVYPCASATEGMDCINQIAPDLVLTDIMLPDLDGMSLVDLIRSNPDINRTPIIMLSARSQHDDVRHGMSHGADDYLTKPFTFEDLKEAIEALIRKTSMRESLHRKQQREIQWLKWKQDLDKIDFIRIVTRSLSDSITQGKGIGSLVSYLGMIELTAEEAMVNGQKKIVLPEKLIESIDGATQATTGWLLQLTEIAHYFDSAYEPALLDTDTQRLLFTAAVAETEKLLVFKKQTLDSSGLSPYKKEIFFNDEALVLSIRELIVNALKFSPDESLVSIHSYVSGGHFIISVINDIQKHINGTSGIPEENELDIFYPFFRLNKFVDERFSRDSLHSGMGLGLTIIQYALRKSGGSIHLCEIENHALNRTQVKAEIKIDLRN